jgi:hypothetical protein
LVGCSLSAVSDLFSSYYHRFDRFAFTHTARTPRTVYRAARTAFTLQATHAWRRHAGQRETWAVDGAAGIHLTLAPRTYSSYTFSGLAGMGGERPEEEEKIAQREAVTPGRSMERRRVNVASWALW